MTRDAILRAAAQEIELNGMTLFRVKRVAYAAGISVGLLYSYFDDREDLIACAISTDFAKFSTDSPRHSPIRSCP